MRPLLYGIPNCDQVRRAVAWLREHRIDHDFHDYKALGAPLALLTGWSERVDSTRLLNRSGTTWRKLAESDRAAAAEPAAALALMSRVPSLIRRPVLDYNRRLLVGFDAETYAELLLPSR
jgi:Spx/MgsR family transcriptional regulator